MHYPYQMDPYLYLDDPYLYTSIFFRGFRIRTKCGAGGGSHLVCASLPVLSYISKFIFEMWGTRFQVKKGLRTNVTPSDNEGLTMSHFIRSSIGMNNN